MKRERVSEHKCRKREEKRTGSLSSLLLLIKTRRHRDVRVFVCVHVCVCMHRQGARARRPCSLRVLVRPHAKVTKKEQYNWRNVRSNNRYSENDNSY